MPDAAVTMPAVLNRGRTYVFHLRKGLRFSNGQPLSAANFAAEINRVLNPAMQAPAVGDGDIGPNVVGAQAVIDGKAKTTSGVIARGNTLTIELTQPRPDILSLLTLPWFCPIPTNLPVDPAGVDFVPGSGPYYVASRQVGQRVVLKRNPHYSGPRPSNTDQIVVSITGTPESNIALVQRNGADLLWDEIPTELRVRLLARYGLNRSLFHVPVSSASSSFLFLNTSSPLVMLT